MGIEITYKKNDDELYEAHVAFGNHKEHGTYGIGQTKEDALEDLVCELSLKLWKIHDAFDDIS